MPYHLATPPDRANISRQSTPEASRLLSSRDVSLPVWIVARRCQGRCVGIPAEVGCHDSECAPVRKGVRILDHVVFIVLVTLLMTAFLPAIGSRTMTPKLSAFWLSCAMLAIGVVLWWMPGHAARGESRRLGFIILPAFIALSLIEIGLTFAAYHCDPNATGLVLFTQILGLIYVSFRS